MKICFLCTLYEVTGGVETLMYRMAKWLEQHGHSVTLISNKIVPPLDEFRNKVILGDDFKYLNDIWRASYYLKQLKNIDCDVIKTFHVYDALKAAVLGRMINKNVKIIAGVYTPLQFVPAVMGKDIIEDYFNLTDKTQRLICFADSLIEIEQLSIRVNDKTVHYFPLPVESVGRIKRNPKWGKIVSIGRIAEMKGYNFYMVDVTKKLNSMGFDVKYHIYGDGEKQADLEKYIKLKDANECVYFHGKSRYQDFAYILKDAYIFVGMGTALIEAAQLGVPSLCAIPYDYDGKCYGRFYEFPFEIDKQRDLFKKIETKEMINEILCILKMLPSEYSNEERRNQSHGELWKVNNRMLEFMEIVAKANYTKNNSIYLHTKRISKFIENKYRKYFTIQNTRKNTWTALSY